MGGTRDLREAQARISEFQYQVKLRLLRLAKNKDSRCMGEIINRGRLMGIPAEDLADAERDLKDIEESHHLRSLKEGANRCVEVGSNLRGCAARHTASRLSASGGRSPIRRSCAGA